MLGTELIASSALTPRFSQNAEAERRVFSMLQILAPSPQSVVSMVCEKLSSRGPTAVDRNKSPYAA